MYHNERNITNFWIAGLNYKKTETSIRGKFAINNDQYTCILANAAVAGLNSFFILSTCNRTEIYGLSDSPERLMQLLCSETEGSYEEFSNIAYVKNGWDAVEHLFNVGAGLDSQILGDYEILGQIKNAAKFAKDGNVICPFMERFINNVIQTSKAVKTNTELSGGTVSVSFAAVQYIKNHIKDIKNKKILLLGTGKIGRNTCKNLVDYLETNNITLINRTEEKAQKLAGELGLKTAPLSRLNEEVGVADIILVATNSTEPVIVRSQLEGKGDKLIIDLSVPCNVEIAAQALPGIRFVNVDELSKIKDETLHKREAELPKAKAIIQEHVAEFKEWYDMRKYVPMLKEVKDKLQEIHSTQTTTAPEERIQKVINTLATKVRRNNTAGCCYIEAINEFIA
jgi:glutamyl-tRNA reductase